MTFIIRREKCSNALKKIVIQSKQLSLVEFSKDTLEIDFLFYFNIFFFFLEQVSFDRKIPLFRRFVAGEPVNNLTRDNKYGRESVRLRGQLPGATIGRMRCVYANGSA